MNSLCDLVVAAESRIRPFVRETFLEQATWLNRRGTSVYCKCENLQYTGSFKVRGAMNKLLSLTIKERKRGVVAASTGNHGAAVAFGLKVLGVQGIVFVPERADAVRIKAIRKQGAEVRRYGDDPVLTEIHARRFAAKKGMIYLSPYNDLDVVAGQGTIGVELHRQLQHVDAIFASIGGGGLISGVASYLKTVNPRIKVFGCSPRNSDIMIRSVKAGRIVDAPSLPTLSESTMGGIEPDAITFNFCHSLVDHYITVTEGEIRDSLIKFMENQHMLIEGAAAVSIAAYLRAARNLAGMTVVIIICGANINARTLNHILSKKRCPTKSSYIE